MRNSFRINKYLFILIITIVWEGVFTDDFYLDIDTLEKCFLKEKTYWLNVIIQEIKIISKEIKLFLKTGLKLKQDM